MMVNDFERYKFDDYALVKELKDAGVLDELDHLNLTGVPRCPVCKKDFVPAVDSVTGAVSKYSWRPDCEHCKGMIMSLG